MKKYILYLLTLSFVFAGNPSKFPDGIKTKFVEAESETLLIATGVVTASKAFVTLQAETGTADDLATINGLKTGQQITLVADTGDTITLKDGTGNLLIDGNDFVLNSGNIATGTYDGTNLRISAGAGGSGEVNTISNQGVGGVSVVAVPSKVGVDLQLNSINAASTKVTVTLDGGNKEIDLDVDGGLILDGEVAGNGIVTKTAAETYTNRTMTGTANQITIVNGDGVAGNPTYSITDDPIFSGNISLTLPIGSTAQETGVVNGMIRYNSDTNKFRARENGSWVDMIGGGGGGGADTALSNLAAVAINTSLISDTDATDDIGSLAIRWTNIFAQNMNTGDTAADELKLQAYDVDGASFTTFATLTANNTPTMSLSGDVTSTTQTPSDNSLKLATTAYVDLAILAGGTTAQKEIGVALSNETSDLTVGVAKITFRMPIDMTLTGVRANVNTAPTGSSITVDINKTGVGSLLSTLLTINATELTSETASVPAVISTSALSSDDEITIDIDVIGSTIAGKGLKIWLIGTTASIDNSETIVTRKKLDSITLGAPSALITFTGIDQTYDKLIIKAIARTDQVSPDDNLILEFNNDSTTSNYHTQFLYAGDAISTTSELANALRAGSVSAGSSPANAFGVVHVDIDNYAGSKLKITDARFYMHGSANNNRGGHMYGFWNDTSAITEIDITPNVGPNFVTGSTFELWGEKEITVGGGGSTDGWQNIGSEVTASGDALLEFDVSDTSFTQYRLIVNGMTPSVDSTNIFVQAFIGSYITTGYAYHSKTSVSGSTSYFAVTATNGGEWIISSGETLGTGTGEGADFKIDIYNPASTTQRKRMRILGLSTDGSAQARSINSFCYVGNSGAMTKFKVYASSGNIAGGSFQLQGFKPTP